MTSLLCNWYFKKQDEKKIKEQEIGLLGGTTG